MSEIELSPEQGFGTFAPRGLTALILRLCHGVSPSWPAARTWNKLLRGLIKRPRRQWDVTVGGLKLRLRNGGNYSEKRQLFEPQFYDTEEIDWLCSLMEDGGWFLDVGGNIGLYSLHVGRRCPTANIVTVEPDEQLSQRMLFAAELNGVRIDLAKQALSDYTGKGSLLSSGEQAGENTLSVSTDEGDQVSVTTLLELCTSRNIDRIRALKIDIEGHEDRVLSHFFANAPESLWPEGIVIEDVHNDQALIGRLQHEYGYHAEGRTKRNVLLRRQANAAD